MYGFLRSPKWLLGIAIAVAAVIVFVNLGFWQLSRHEERGVFNETLEHRVAAEPVPLSAAVAEPGAHAYRRTTVVGEYLHEREVLLAARSSAGRAGHHVLTPLRTDSGIVIVDRGWVPFELTDPPIAEAAPPTGQVTVQGVLFPGAEAGRSGAFDGGERLEFVSAVDLDLLAGWVGETVAPLYLLAQEQQPPAGELPVAAVLPELEAGNHLSYAVQWFLFAGVVLVGFPLLVVRTGRDAGVEAQAANRERVSG